MNKQNILNFEDFLNTYKDKKQVRLEAKRLFPIKSEESLTEEYSYLIGKVMGDGNLDNKYTLRFIGQKEDLMILKDLIVNKFSINSERFSIRKRVHKGISYLLQVNCAYLGRILFLLGAPIGNKTKKIFKVPKWILANQNLKKKFLQALLEDELTTIKIEKCNYSVKPMLKLAKKEDLISYHREFMKQIKECIESFGIECSHISKPLKAIKTYELYFNINRNKKNIIKFKENIGFRLNQNKIEKLNECYNILKTSLKK